MQAAPMIIMAVAAAAATVYSAYEQNQQAKAQAAALEANAKMADTEAKLLLEKGKMEALDISEEKRQNVGQNISLISGAGLGLTGSPMEMLIASQANYERDLMRVGYNAEVQSRVKTQEARNLNWEAEALRKQGLFNLKMAFLVKAPMAGAGGAMSAYGGGAGGKF